MDKKEEKEEKPLEEKVKECPENNFCHRGECDDGVYCKLSYFDPPETKACPNYNDAKVVMVTLDNENSHSRRYHICNAAPSDNPEQ